MQSEGEERKDPVNVSSKNGTNWIMKHNNRHVNKYTSMFRKVVLIENCRGNFV